MSEKLKPCPFCGKQPKTWFDVDALTEGYNVKCCDILITTIFMSDAIKAWNNRPVEDALVEALEALLNHTKNDHCIRGLNEQAKAALALAKLP